MTDADNFIAYRSIGLGELNALISDGVVRGMFDCSDQDYTTATMDHAVCAHTERFFWEDVKHFIFLELSIPKCEAEESEATYFVDEDREYENIWDGTKGYERITIPEICFKEYCADQVKAIYIGNVTDMECVDAGVFPFCEKHKIKIVTKEEMTEIPLALNC